MRKKTHEDLKVRDAERLFLMASVAALAAGLSGCKPPIAPEPAPEPIPGVTFLGDRAHPVKIFHLSADGRAAVGYVFDGEKLPPAGTETLDGGMPEYAHSFHWTEAGGVKVIRTRDGRDVEVAAISANGTTIVGRYFDETSPSHAFRWSEAGGVEDLGRPDGCEQGGCGEDAVAVSADGAVIFGTLRGGASDDSFFGSFRWTRATGVRNLHIPGEIRAATADGSTAVGMTWVDRTTAVAVNRIDMSHEGDAAHVFRWSLAHGYEDLGAPAGVSTTGFSYVMPVAVSADGSTIVGEYTVQSGGTRAFRWTRAGGFQNLAGDGRSGANDVSGDGSVIMGYLAPTSGGGLRAVRWVNGGPPQPIGPPALKTIAACCISADGRTIAGAAAVGKGDRRAFLLRLK